MNNKFKAKVLLGFLVIGGLFSKTGDMSVSYAMKRASDIDTSCAWSAVPYHAFRRDDEGTASGETALHDTWFELLDVDADLALNGFLSLHGRECLNWSDRDGVPSLHHAALHGCNKAVRFLLDNGVDINSRDSLGRTPLMCASERIDQFSYHVVKLLLERDANIHLADAQGRTAFHRVCASGIHCLITEFGLRHADENHRDLHNITPRDELNEVERRRTEEWARIAARVADNDMVDNDMVDNDNMR